MRVIVYPPSWMFVAPVWICVALMRGWYADHGNTFHHKLWGSRHRPHLTTNAERASGLILCPRLSIQVCLSDYQREQVLAALKSTPLVNLHPFSKQQTCVMWMLMTCWQLFLVCKSATTRATLAGAAILPARGKRQYCPPGGLTTLLVLPLGIRGQPTSRAAS